LDILDDGRPLAVLLAGDPELAVVEHTELVVVLVVLAPEQDPGAQDAPVTVRPNGVGADVRVVHSVGHIEIGLDVVRAKLQDEGAVLDLHRGQNRPASRVVGEVVLEDDVFAITGLCASG
jgi:hypothetical protein